MNGIFIRIFINVIYDYLDELIDLVYRNNQMQIIVIFSNLQSVGWGTDEKAVIEILGHRNASQRQQIRDAYQQLFQEDLIKRLESELSGDFEVCISLIYNS